MWLHILWHELANFPEMAKLSYWYRYLYMLTQDMYVFITQLSHLLSSMLYWWVQCAGFRMELSLFQSDEAYTQVRHTGCLVLSSFSRPNRVGVRQGGYRDKITTPASDSTRRRRGWERESFWPCVHHCRRGKPHSSNKVKHLPVWLRWQWRRGRGTERGGDVGGPGVIE